MSQVRLLSLALVLLTSASVFAQPGPARHDRRTDLFRNASIDQAWRAAQVSRKPMFLYVTSESCFYCEKMRKETLSHPQIVEGVAGFAEPVEFNASEAPELAKKLGVRVFPTILVVSPQNKLLHKVEGFVDPEEFAETVWPVLRQADLERRVALRDQGQVAAATGVVQPVSVRE